MNDRLLSALSLCRKAGRLTLGMDVCQQAAQDGTARLMLTASDLAPRSRRRIEETCEAVKLPIASLPYDMEQLWSVLGRRCGIVAVCDEGFANMVLGLLPQRQEA